jgi:hypothetical protein
VTTVIQPRAQLPSASPRQTGAPGRRALLPPGWPLRAAVAGYGVGWLLGFGDFIFPLLAVPMGAALLRRRRIRVPAGFGLWLLFLAFVLVSGVMSVQDAPGTVPGNSTGHLQSWALRAAQYLSATVILLYLCNLTERELPSMRVVRALGVMFIVTVAGGYLGILAPRLQITTPLELLLPPALTSIEQIGNTVHPPVAQVQGFLGYAVARPSAPFQFTNAWGANLALFLPFFVAGWLTRQCSPGRRLAGGLILAAALVPIVYSLNRGMWLGLVVAIVYLAVRLAARGRTRLLVGVVLAVALAVVAFLASPLNSLVSARLEEGHSNERRTELADSALRGALGSPLLGWGTTRDSIGSSRSIAIGRSADCPKCGTPPTGTHGHLYLVTYSQGLLGVTLYVGFFALAWWRYRRDGSDVGLACSTALLLYLMFMAYYNLLAFPQVTAVLAVGLLWRGSRAAKEIG